MSAVYEVRITRVKHYDFLSGYFVWRADVRRVSDGREIARESRSLALLRWRLRRSALDRAFARLDARLAKLREWVYVIPAESGPAPSPDTTRGGGDG